MLSALRGRKPYNPTRTNRIYPRPWILVTGFQKSKMPPPRADDSSLEAVKFSILTNALLLLVFLGAFGDCLCLRTMTMKDMKRLRISI